MNDDAKSGYRCSPGCIPVDFPAVPDSKNKNGNPFVVDFIDYPVISHTNTIGIAVFQFYASLWARVVGEAVDGVINGRNVPLRELFVIPNGRGGDENFVHDSTFYGSPAPGRSFLFFCAVIGGDIFQLFNIFQQFIVVLFGKDDTYRFAFTVDDVVFFNWKH